MIFKDKMFTDRIKDCNHKTHFKIRLQGQLLERNYTPVWIIMILRQMYYYFCILQLFRYALFTPRFGQYRRLIFSNVKRKNRKFIKRSVFFLKIFNFFVTVFTIAPRVDHVAIGLGRHKIHARFH